MKCPMCGADTLDDLVVKGEMTNEEWLRKANTEQLAEELLAWWFDGANTYSEFGLYNREIEEAKERIVKWLKEIHEE